MDETPSNEQLESLRKRRLPTAEQAEIFRLRRQLKNLTSELRHIKMELNQQRMLSPAAYDEEEEMGVYLDGLRQLRLDHELDRATARDDGLDHNGDAGPLD